MLPPTPPSPPTSPAPEHRCGFVALIGRPNVGKSTLLNTLVGVKVAIVTPKPQTTRTRLLGVKTLSHTQLLFLDTPGMHEPQGSLLNRRMVDVAQAVLREADVVLFLLDATRGILPPDEALAERLHRAGALVVGVVNKIDLIPRAALAPLLERLAALLPRSEVVPVSALTGENSAELERLLIALLPVGPALYAGDDLTDQSERVLAQEMVREQLFVQTQQEVPYATAVMVEEFRERPGKGPLFVRAVIYVERPSQRAIIIGERGARLGRIGQAARLQMEAFFGRKVFLELFVKVAKGWTNNPGVLKDLGL